MEKKKRNIIIALAIVLIGVLIAFVFSLINSNKTTKRYPEEIIEQQSISTSKQEIELKETFEGTEREIYATSNATQLENIQTMITDLNLNIKEESSEEGAYYIWTGDNWSFMYELDQNYLIFNIEEGIETGKAALNSNSFSNFVNKYFSLEFEYTVFESAKRENGETISYAKRKIGEDNLETKLHNKYTDYLALKDGKIVYGKILLTQFKETDILTPLITSESLKEIINLDGYPKEVYPDFSVLQSNVLQEIDYKEEAFEEVAESLKECQSSSMEIVYLYRSMEDIYLTPVYKILTECIVEHENDEFSIPATMYVNAIDPQYVSIPE